MQLTHYTDYGLRVLIFLSIQETEQRVTISEISEHFQIPRNHLVKVVHRLGQLSYVHSTRGKNGGIVLGQAANKIIIGDVVRNMESTLDVVNCESPSPCPITSNCQLKSILQSAGDAFLNVLDQYTIADLQKASGQLNVLLNWKTKAH
jgi:Rrf2 family transcriptional regulator, nitric oxide-sensitive transcriptional repressor